MIIGRNHTETRCKSFKISRCERLVRIIAGYKIRKKPMYSPKYVDYLDKMRIDSAFYNPKSKPKT